MLQLLLLCVAFPVTWGDCVWFNILSISLSYYLILNKVLKIGEILLIDSMCLCKVGHFDLFMDFCRTVTCFRLCCRWSRWSICCLLRTPETSQPWGGICSLIHATHILRQKAKDMSPRSWRKTAASCFGGDSRLVFLLCSCRFALSSMDMEQRDYDSRTALHVAAAEGLTIKIPYYTKPFFSLLVCT